MTAGFQAFDGAGRLSTDITDRFTQLVLYGSVVLVDGQSHFVPVAGMDTGDAWHVCASQGAYVFYSAGGFTLRPSSSFGYGTIFYTVWYR